jgi:hypothetical protein
MQQELLQEKLTINTLRLLKNLLRTGVVGTNDFKMVLETMFGKLAMCLDKNSANLSLVAEVVAMLCKEQSARRLVASASDYHMSLL